MATNLVLCNLTTRPDSVPQRIPRTSSSFQVRVPSGVGRVAVTAVGAQGGDGKHPGGMGASLYGEFSVTSGEQLTVLAGTQPPPSPVPFHKGNSCGGGGASFVARMLGAAAC